MSPRSWFAHVVTPILGGVLVVLISTPAISRAQTTLVVRGAAQSHPAIEVALDEVLRAELGSRARRVEISLGDLALAAGCGHASEEPVCIGAIARAAAADLVAIEHVRRDGETYHVHVVLYASSGERLRALDTECVPGRCESALATAVHGAEPMDEPMETSVAREPSGDVATSAEAGAAEAPTPRRGSARTVAASETSSTSGAARSTAEGAPPNDGGDLEIRASTVMYTGAAITGFGAIISGIVSADASGRAAGLGVVRTRADADTLVAAEQARDGALVTGVVLALAGAGLAVTGMVLQTTEHDVHVTALPLAAGAMLACGGTF